MRSVKFLLCYCRDGWRRGDTSSGILARCMSSERRMPPEMPAPVKKIPLFLVAPRRDQSEGSRTGPWTVRDLKGARVLEASRIPLPKRFGCPKHIVDAKAAAAAPSSQVAAHRLPPTPRAPPEPPPHAAAPPLHAAASGRRNAATAAADARRRDAQRQQCPPHATPPAPHTQQQTPLENRHYAGS